MTEERQAERRSNLALRERVDAAYALIAPFFTDEAKWVGLQQDMLALRTLRDQMPDLDPLEAQLVVSVARRLARNGGGR